MDMDFPDAPSSPNADGCTTIFSGSRDTIHDAPAFTKGDRFEFALDYPDLEGVEPVARAGDAATVVLVAPMTRPTYNVILASEPNAKWPRTVAGRYLVPEGDGIRGSQETSTVLIRGTGELKRF
ncbi:hypothetical protein J3A64_004769 [Pseudarthrobacter sp. PvP004]|uniref:hypothetical protein n=1 Tax=Pseudarthrobacter sp. PvP004 TaxID=2817850 RepID=UPI001AE2CCF0|nr:hypothetical protein [Pseudarthrobacter sp. PvP004]MBP2269229.1 hypothetical protein [Pseudarthrobacter sp. PvP004]